jgi:hypothetical protein
MMATVTAGPGRTGGLTVRVSGSDPPHASDSESAQAGSYRDRCQTHRDWQARPGVGTVTHWQ